MSENESDQAQIKQRATMKANPTKDATEKDLILRLDVFLLTFGCISQVIKYLDQQNVNTAYVSGMKEDLNMTGNDYNYLTTYFNVGYCIFLIPSQTILTLVRPSLWLPSLEICWGIITGLVAMTHRVEQVFILRAFLGLCESSAWPGMVTMLTNWYTPTELAKRISIYHSCQGIGNMMAGSLQAALKDTMDGRYGLSGWRWLFIINAILTVIIGGAGFFMIPDTPANPNPRAVWFSKKHSLKAQERDLRHGKAEPKAMTIETIKRTITSPTLYLIATLYILTVLTTTPYQYFNLWLKSLTNPDGSQMYSTSQVNLIPVGGSSINVVFVWVWAFLSDYLQTRWLLIIAQALIALIPDSMLLAWDIPFGAKYTAWILLYVSLGTAPLIMAWMAEQVPHDPEQRALIIGASVAFYYAISAWSQVLIWPASEAPHYSIGWQVSIAMWVVIILQTCGMRWLQLQKRPPPVSKEEAFPDLAQEDFMDGTRSDADSAKSPMKTPSSLPEESQARV